jgi:hypothetical protein
MKEIWSGPASRAVARYGEHAPLATACCNACRACVTTNLVGIAWAAAGGLALAAVGFARRAVGRAARSS